MKSLWSEIKRLWQHHWVDDAEDDTVLHLSQSDKRSLCYGVFLACSCTALACILSVVVNVTFIVRRDNAYVEEAMDLIAVYLASATGNEYEGILQTVRHDLVIRGFDRELVNFIQYIPNTADICSLDREGLSAQAYLVCANTGEVYPLDLQEGGPGNGSKDMDLSFGYDEISQTSIHIAKHPEQGEGFATLHRDSGIVSVQRMKAYFCDDCIRNFLTAVEDCRIKELAIVDVEEKIFYPVEDGTTLEIGSCVLRVVCLNGDCRILIE